MPYRRYFELIASDSYRQPAGTGAPKSFGYIGNVVFQIHRLLDEPADPIHRQTFYLADYEPVVISEWSNLISQKLHQRNVRILPGPLVRLAALGGDLLKHMGFDHPPMTSYRLRNMRVDTSGIPLNNIRQIADPLPYTLESGVDETLNWMRHEGIIDWRSRTSNVRGSLNT